MSKQKTTNDDGIIGLGVLLLMTIAIIAAEAKSGHLLGALPGSESSKADGPGVLLERAQSAPRQAAVGTIRELRVVPRAIEAGLDLDWLSDDAALESYRQNGL